MCKIAAQMLGGYSGDFHNFGNRVVWARPYVHGGIQVVAGANLGLDPLGHSLLLLIPDDSLLETPFAEWTEATLETQTCTAFWQLDQDEVLWAPGTHNRESIHRHGRTLENWAESERP